MTGFTRHGVGRALAAGVFGVGIFGLCVAAMAGASEDDSAATAAYKRADYATALRLIRPLAEQGDALAQVNLGGLYSDGRGVTKDARAAADWYRKAADQNFAPGGFFLGQALAGGAGVPQDRAEGIRLIRKAADQGYAPAELMLGMGPLFTALAQLPPVPQAEADQWLRKAVDAGYAPAVMILGLRHAIHIGLPEEQAEALRLLRLAANQGDATAEQSLGDLLAREHGVPPDYNEAAQWYLKSAEQGNASSQSALGRMYVMGQGVPKDPVTGRMWFELSQRRFAGKDEDKFREVSERLFELEGGKVTGDQMAEAKRRAAAWAAQHPPKPSSERWVETASGVATSAISNPASPAAHTCTHEEQVQARIAKQNGYTGGPKCD